MTPTLYLTRTGLLEPLGQSQVLAYLRGLSQSYRITLITFEKDEDRQDSARMNAARAECAALGIRWLPQRFVARPRIISPALAMVRLLFLVWREVRRERVQLIHARSYVPAAVALGVRALTGVPFVFDMRALWPEELITSGRLRRGSLLHRLIGLGERACLRHAAGVVSLTQAGLDHLRRLHPEALARQRLAVIPTCADLDRFVPAPVPPEGKVIGCLGTMLSGWFRIDWLAAFLAAVARRDPEMRFLLTTRDDPQRLRDALALSAALQDRLVIAPSPPEAVPALLHRQMASVMFFTDGLGKLGSSPTRMAEVLGCGLPVVTNAGVGDVAQIVRSHRVGVIVTSADADTMDLAFEALVQLCADPDLGRRCRAAAEAVFSLQAGTEAYHALYRAILAGGTGPGRAR